MIKIQVLLLSLGIVAMYGVAHAEDRLCDSIEPSTFIDEVKAASGYVGEVDTKWDYMKAIASSPAKARCQVGISFPDVVKTSTCLSDLNDNLVDHLKLYPSLSGDEPFMNGVSAVRLLKREAIANNIRDPYVSFFVAKESFKISLDSVQTHTQRIADLSGISFGDLGSKIKLILATDACALVKLNDDALTAAVRNIKSE
jgi:hypothetical protein